MAGFLEPQAQISERALDCGVRNLMLDALFATAVGALNSGVVIVAYALWLGASNTVIGILAAVPLWTQVLQAPAISLVERMRKRRRISVIGLLIARSALPVMALLPYLGSRPIALGLLLALETIHTGFNAICACSWNSWIRDLVPGERLGRFFARRSIYASAIGTVCSLAAGYAMQHQRAGHSGGDGSVFTVLYLCGWVAAMLSTWRLALVPEPVMPAPQPKQTLWSLLKAPLKDENFRNLIRFMASWQFAVNAATPFFTVFFLQQLHLGIGWITLFTVVSQFTNMLVLRAWGRLSDRFSNKSVLNVAAPAFIVCIAAMVLASQITNQLGVIVYLSLLHAFMGMASAGVGLASGNIAMKLAPRHTATAFIAANSLISSIAAGIAPILGGLSADYYAGRELSFQMLWRNPMGVRQVAALQVTHWDFYFLISAAIGLYAMHRLSFIREEGTIERADMMQQIVSETRRGVRNLSPVRGLRPAFPAAALLDLHARYRGQARVERARAARSARNDAAE